MTTRLVLCFDGTWNRPDANPDPAARVETNVSRFYESVADGQTADGAVQHRWYDTGVGTNWYDRFAGGAFGFGLDEKIKDGYRWLSGRYPDPDPGDIQVFVIGFSRGAYSARSLVGMIRKVGLLRPEHLDQVDAAYALYRVRAGSADIPAAVDFRARYSRDIKIKFIGVWDTVGALGIPLHALMWLNAIEYGFHDTELSGIVETAAHAVAIDEHRVDYQATLWTPPAGGRPKPQQTVEQRWFVGAHADVGGGYPSRDLSDIALAWMMRKAAAAGLSFGTSPAPAIGRSNWVGEITDSYGTFLGGIYAMTHDPYYRPIDTANGLAQVVDETAIQRYREAPTYRPQNTGFPVPLPPESA